MKNLQNKMIKDKEFLVYWGDGYKPDIKKVNSEYFSEDNGYEKDDINFVSKIPKNKIKTLPDKYGTQIIKRIK